jgi:hypothetical protein
MYFANPTTQPVRDAMKAGLLGAIATPAQRNQITDMPVWCADNGCYGDGYPGGVGYLRWLAELQPHADRCAFATAPDVVADAEMTLIRSEPFLPVIRALGYHAAFVAQDGLENLAVPWDSFDVLFIGGSTGWKLGPQAARIASEALKRGKHVHMGRVNSLKRLRYAQSIGCTSADGTYVVYGPEVNLPTLLDWMIEVSWDDLNHVKPDPYFGDWPDDEGYQ